MFMLHRNIKVKVNVREASNVHLHCNARLSENHMKLKNKASKLFMIFDLLVDCINIFRGNLFTGADPRFPTRVRIYSLSRFSSKIA